MESASKGNAARGVDTARFAGDGLSEVACTSTLHAVTARPGKWPLYD